MSDNLKSNLLAATVFFVSMAVLSIAINYYESRICFKTGGVAVEVANYVHCYEG